MLRSRSALIIVLLLSAIACGRMLLIRPSADPWQPQIAAATARPRLPQAACTDRQPLRQAFFGDLHIHTKYSMDARGRGMLGSPDDALRFARGETIRFGPFDEQGIGQRPTRLERPLDFAAVTDHAEWIGEVTLCTTPGSPAYDAHSCQVYRGEAPLRDPLPGVKVRGTMTAVIGAMGRKNDICGDGDERCRTALLGAWQDTQRATETWNDRTAACAFTAFHGWEHSYSVNMSKVHRNVIFRNADVPELPISSLERPGAVALWDELDRVCTQSGTGCEAVTIPHNSNVSNGRLFEITWKRESLEEQRRQARMRARLERLVEIMQVKGESECQNGMFGVLGEEDELCDFEKIRAFKQKRPNDCKKGIGSGALGGRGCQSRVDFARYALAEGMRESERLGINPFQFGFIGSTDGHNANPGDVEEASYEGCCSDADAEIEARLSTAPAFAGSGQIARNPGGLMGIWAEENSRDALFDGIQRRETFATSGPRLQPRFFGGWDLPEDACDRDDLVATGYRLGVPMGDVLSSETPPDGAPLFVASVLRDPGTPERPGGLLDRLQIIKVWHGEGDTTHQSVFDMDGRLTEAETRARASVDLNTCEPRGAGHDELCGVWRDPDFDPNQAAAYYVRAVENPSCRWSWRTCLALPEVDRPVGCSDPEIPKVIQERAWTSPIWYEPRNAS